MKAKTVPAGLGADVELLLVFVLIADISTTPVPPTVWQRWSPSREVTKSSSAAFGGLKKARR